MRHKCASAILVVSSILALAGASHAQEVCTALLKDGVFDNTNITQTPSKYKHAQSVVCSSTYSDYTNAQKQSADAGISLDDILGSFGSFGYHNDSSSYGSSRSAFCSQNQNELYITKSYVQKLSTANVGLANAFNKCINSLSKGFEYYVETTPNAAQFVFHTKMLSCR
jgi:hypothetical protein